VRDYFKTLRSRPCALLIALLASTFIAHGQFGGGTVLAWGDDTYGQTNVPAGLRNVVSLAANSYYTLAVKSDGTVAAWGRFYSYYISLPPLFNVAAVAAGVNHSLALYQNGTIMGWGDNSNGQLDVPAGLNNVVGIRATQYNSYALKGDGTIAAWGPDAFGSTQIPESLSNVVAIAAGTYFGLAVKCDGTVVPWGWGSVPGGLTNVVAVEASDNGCLALNGDGTVVSWANDVPTNVVNAVGIAVGGGRSLVLKSDGTVVSWGADTYVPAGLSRGVGIAAGMAHAAAIVNAVTPLIFRQPFLSQTVYSGTKVLLNVGAAGQPALTYQWRYNGTNLPGATNATLVLSTVQTGDAGTYSARLGNAMGNLTSRNATLTVVEAPPIVMAQPASQTWVVGSNAVFTVAAIGSQPFTYQWQFNGTNISGATDATLTVTNLQLAQAGSYEVVVGNSFGSVLSSNALLRVMDLAGALNATNLIWQTSGSLPWFPTTGSSFDGVAAAQAGDVTSSAPPSVLQTAINGPATVTFWWYLSVYNGLYSTSLSFFANDAVQAQLTGSTGWQQQTFYLGEGPQTLQWVYASVYPTPNVDFAGLDEVSVVPGSTAPFVMVPPADQTRAINTNVTFTVTANGTPPLSYQWLYNSNSIAGATNAALVLTNLQTTNSGFYSVIVSSPHGTTNSSSALLTVIDFAAALNTTNLTWQTLGDRPWIVTTSSSHDGVASAQTGGVADSQQQSVLQTAVTGPATLTYWWYLSSGSWTYPASLELTANGATVSQFTTGFGWFPQTSYVGAGPQTLQWIFTSANPTPGADVGGLDQVSVVTEATAPFITASPVSQSLPAGTNVSLTVTAAGTPPLYYQWLYNSNSVAGATNTALVLTNVQTNDSGVYSVVVSNAYGLTNSVDATLTVTSTPPTILVQPFAPPAWPNATVSLSVSAIGSLSLSYQWRINGTNILNATNSGLTLPNVQFSDSANYSVVVSNAVGETTSSNAVLTVSQVVPWGAGLTNRNIKPDYGQCRLPVGMSNALSVAAGGFHGLALRPRGSVTAWGSNTYGQTNVPSTLTNAAAVAAGLNHSVAVRSNRTVSCWGYGGYGLISPPTSATNVMAIAAGWYHNLALRSNGTVVAWGAGTFQGSAPMFGQSMVPTNLTGVTAVAAGGYHSLALRRDGTVVGWGWNASGQTNVPAGLSNVVAIAAGASNSIALKNDGTLVAWGANSYGQTNIPPGLSNVVAISAGAAHNMALKDDGTVVVWGLSDNGQTNVPAGLNNIAAISAGACHSLALVNIGPVTFLGPPYSQTVYKGGDAAFAAPFLGAAPVSYQWLQNATNVVNGTNATLVITNVQFTDAGAYQLVVSNAYGAVASAPAVLTIVDTAPFFTVQPTNRWVIQGSNATLSASAGGLPTLYYQWQLNGGDVAGATNATITVTNAQLANEGNYSLVASNAHGVMTSSNAFLDVVDVPQALGPANLTWQNPSQPGWFAESTNTHDGFAAAAVGPIPYSSLATLQTTVTGPGTLTFWWADSLDVMLSFYVDGLIQATWLQYSSSTWNKPTCYLTSGTHLLTWTASNAYFPSYTGMAFLDQVAFTPGPTAATITSQPTTQTNAAGNDASFSVSAIGTPPLLYQWQFGGADILGATNAVLTLHDIQTNYAGTYAVTVTNAFGSAVSSNATLVVTPSAPTITAQPVSRSNVLNSIATFTVSAKGSSPLCYNWQFNGASLPAATNNVLTLTAQAADAGSYQVMVSNLSGSVTSRVVTLTVTGPAILVANGSVGIWSNRFNFSVAAIPGEAVVIEASTNLMSWVPVQTNFLGSAEPFVFFDRDTERFSHRFYRARLYAGSLPPPAIQANDGMMGFQQGQFGFDLAGVAGQTAIVETSTNLVDWMPLVTNVLPVDPVYITDANSTNSACRFYRVRLE
jgi:alpha-tubulin suppressor-like RCC1 family protein